jgi:uncharacterized DUF497 family protein
MDFEWDDAKDEATRQGRGFGFAYAIQIFAGPTFETSDTRLAYGKDRVKAIGKPAGMCWS